MTELRLEPYHIPSALLGPENPLPHFRAESDDLDPHADASVPEEDRRYLGWGCGDRVLPHRMQDNYDRVKRPHAFRAAVLENEFLRATVLPEIGGRLVSLLHKPSNRELVDRNSVFQPANLALRNAWFCGGIEWNAGQFGHHYLTCSPVFAARIEGPDGSPALRIYEWDRVKRFCWQVDLILPPGSQMLFTRVRIVNPHDVEIPMYWWTNLGVLEAPGVRTLVPADSAIHNAGAVFALTQVPELDGADITYPVNSLYAKEFFFRVPDDRRKWMASVDSEGRGIFQASTARLRGRKMFVFGMNPGGQRWKEYLMVPGRAYYEIQAGLARTQFESIPMPANTEWTWTEAFGLLELDPSQAHSKDWDTACRAAESELDSIIPQSQLDRLHEEFDSVTRRAPSEILSVGSGWGALERRRLVRQTQPDRVPAELVFDESTLGPDQEPWHQLLETGTLPERDPRDEPGCYMTQPEWRSMLDDSISSGSSDHWLAWLHLGVMRMEEHDSDGARVAWQASLDRCPNAWALRNLAVLESRTSREEAACDLLRQAWELGPKIAPIAVEYGQSLTRLTRHEDLIAFFTSLPHNVAADERLRVMNAAAAIKLGRLDGLEGFFDSEFVTIREGEVTLTDLWFSYHEQRIAQADGIPIDDELARRVRREFPSPAHIDFRMGPA